MNILRSRTLSTSLFGLFPAYWLTRMDLPETPGGGRSRHSKALPVPPKHRLPPTKGEISPTITSIAISLLSPLPPLPEDTMSTKSITRRPIGGTVIHTKISSVGSASSIYSDSPGFSRGLSNSIDQANDSPNRFGSETAASTPPLPPKDPQRQQLPKMPKPLLASPVSKFETSPPRPELWRRRSVNSDKAISLSELELTKSNGSTASPSQKHPFERSLPAVPTQLPRSITSRKPVPILSRAAPPQPDVMGSKVSKLKEKAKRSSESSSKNVTSIQQSQPSVTRLPTPEYQKTDNQEKLIPQISSPVSPETPPSENTPQLPAKSEARGGSNAGPLVDTTNLPSFLYTASHSRDSSETLTVTSESPVVRSPQPTKTFAARILTPQPSPSTTPVASPLDLPSPAHKLLTFPTLPDLAPEGTIFPAPPLKIVHLECYQSHKFMRPSRNFMYSLGCMVCQKKDAEKRWKCTWCCLSVCGSCMDVLAAVPGKDLKTCLERIEKHH